MNNIDGSPAEADEVVYQVVYRGGRLFTVGSATYTEPGVYTGSFTLSESALGGQLFTGQQPMKLTVRASADGRAVKRKDIYVGRWGCDRCHIEAGLARQLYPWCNPSGGALGPHYWGNILGRNGTPEGFDLSYLTNVDGAVYTATEQTHTPVDYLTSPPDPAHELPGYHERTNVKMSGNPACSPCHQGSGRVRYPWNGTGQPGETPGLAHNRSMAMSALFITASRAATCRPAF